jgi:hypothetical protein
MTVAVEDESGDMVTDVHWRLLRGSAENVRLDISEDGREAEITLTWHDVFDEAALSEETPGRPPAARIDIAVFADNGIALSAPSFITIALPAHQDRQYDTGPDGSPRLVSVDYGLDSANAPGFDPFLFWTAPWSDAPIRDGGRIGSWQRTFSDGTVATMPFEGVAYSRGGPSGSVLSVAGQ